MKILRFKNNASVMVLALVTSAVLFVGLASYFTLVQSQNNAVVRSQTWNTAIPAAEAGIEDALTHLNTILDGSRATNGYSLTNGMYVASRQIGSFRYVVGIDTSNQPAIYSTGYVRTLKGNAEIKRVIKVQSTRFASGHRGLVTMLDINGVTTVDSYDSENPLYSTGGRYDSAKHKDGGFIGSVTGNVDTGGGTVYGYMSTGPNGAGSGNAGSFAWFNAGNSGTEPGHYQKDMNVYFPPVAAPFNGGAVTPTAGPVTLTNFTFGNVLITTNVLPIPTPVGAYSTTTWITVTAYPTGHSPVITNTVFVSSKTFPAAGTYMGAVATRVVTSGNPSGRGTWYDYQAITGYKYSTVLYNYMLNATNYTTTTVNADYVLDSQNYQLSSVGNSTWIVKGNATLYVTGDISMDGNSQITILPGASLKLYVAGASAKIAGNGIVNQSGDTLAFQYFGLPSNTSLALSGNASYTGTFYAPSADLSMNGGGNNTYDFAGASITRSVKMNGHFNFHFDEKLGRLNGPIRYRVASWDEI
jgi:hypothetical protein